MLLILYNSWWIFISKPQRNLDNLTRSPAGLSWMRPSSWVGIFIIGDGATEQEKHLYCRFLNGFYCDFSIYIEKKLLLIFLLRKIFEMVVEGKTKKRKISETIFLEKHNFFKINTVMKLLKERKSIWSFFSCLLYLCYSTLGIVAMQ